MQRVIRRNHKGIAPALGVPHGFQLAVVHFIPVQYRPGHQRIFAEYTPNQALMAHRLLLIISILRKHHDCLLAPVFVGVCQGNGVGDSAVKVPVFAQHNPLGGAGQGTAGPQNGAAPLVEVLGVHIFRLAGEGVGNHHTQGGVRPVVVIQNNTGNRHAPTLVVATVTARTRKKTKQPTHFLIRENPALSRPSMVLLEQIRTIDKQRIERYLGRVTRQEMFGINRALLVSLDLNTSSRQ